MSQYIRKFEPGGTVADQPVADQIITDITEDEKQPVTFRTSQGEYDAEELAKVYEQNIPQFAEYIGFKRGSKKYDQFLLESANIMLGIRNGTLTRGDGMIYQGPTLSDDNKMLKYSLGLLDKILTNYPTKQKKKENGKEKYSFGNLKRYFWNRYYGGNEDADLLSWLDRDKPDENGVRANTNRAAELANMLSDYADSIDDDKYDFSGSAFKDVIEYRKKLKEAADSLRDGTWDNNDAAKLDAIGFSRTLREQLLGDGSTYDSNGNKKEEDPESYEYQLKKKREELLADVKAGIITQPEAKLALEEWKEDYKDQKYGDLIWNTNYQKWANEHWTWEGNTFTIENSFNPGKLNEALQAELTGKYDPDNPSRNVPGLLEQHPDLQQSFSDTLDRIAANERIDNSVWNKKFGATQISYATLFKMWFESNLSNPEAATRIGNSNRYYLNGTFDFEHGTALQYNADKHQFIRVHVDDLKTPWLYKKYKEEYKKRNPRRRSSASGGPRHWAKQGGKLEALASLRNGGIVRKGLLGFDSSSLGKDLTNLSEETYNQNIAEEAKARGISVERVKEAHSTLDWSKPYNWLRGLSVGADAISLGLSASGIGASGAGFVGFAGDLLNLGADALDPGVSAADAWKNLGMNAALSAAAFIPGAGATGKAGKLAKLAAKAGKAGKVARVGALGYGAYNTAMAAPAAFKAVTDSSDMSNDDWRTVTGVASGLTTTTAGVSRGLTQMKYRSKYKTPESITEVSDINGRRYKVTKEQQAAMQKAFDNASKADGATSESVNKAVVDAWANAGGVQLKHTGKALWDDSLEGEWLTRSADPTSEITVNAKNSNGGQREVKLSIEDQNKLRNEYNNARNSVTEELVMREIGEAPTKHFDELSDTKKADFNTKKAELQTAKANEKLKSTFESLDVAKDRVDGFVDEPKFIPSGWAARTGFGSGALDAITRNKPGALSFNEYTPETNPFDVRTAIGRLNVLTRAQSHEGKIGRRNRNYYVGGSDEITEALENNLVLNHGDQFAHLIDSPGFNKLVLAEGLRLNKDMSYRDQLVFATNLLESYKDGSRLNRLGIADVDIPDIIKFYSKKVIPSYQDGVSTPLSKGQAAAAFELDYLNQNKTPDQLLADIQVVDRINNIHAGRGIDDSALEAAIGASKRDVLLKAAKDTYGNIDGFTDEQYINKFLIEKPTKAKSALTSAYNSALTKSDRLNWLNNEGLQYRLAAENAGRTNMTEAQIDAMRADIKTNKDVFDAFSNDPSRALTAEERNLLKSKVDERALEIARDPSKKAITDTELENILNTERAKNSSIEHVENLNLDSSLKTELQDFLDQLKLAYERARMSEDEISNRLAADRIAKADELFNAKQIAENNAKIYEDQLYLNQKSQFNAEQTRYGKWADTKDMADQWNAFIDLTAERNKSMLPTIAGLDLMPKFKGLLKSEVSQGRKLDDVLTDFNSLDDTTKLTILSLANEKERFYSAYKPSGPLPPGKTRSGASYNWKLPSSTVARGDTLKIEPSVKGTITKLFNGLTITDNQVLKIAKAYGFNTPVDVDKFKTFLLNSKEILKYVVPDTNNPGKFKSTAFSDPANIDDIAKYLNRAKLLDFFRYGGTLNKLKSLRTVNFTTDGINSSLISSNKQGGVLNAAKGDKVVMNPSDWEWYANLYSLKELGHSDLRDHNQEAKESLKSNDHNLNFDLGLAAAKNDAYISNHDVVSDDLLRYYDSAYNGDSIEDYVNHYNSDAAKIRQFWGVGEDGKLSDTAWNANTDQSDAIAAHNRLFKNMFYNRSLATVPDGLNYGIGYQDNIDNKMGTSTWMRRMDRRKVEYENDTEEGKASRRFKIRLKNGTEAWVYKKANGDIAVLPQDLVPDEKLNPILAHAFRSITTPLGAVLGSNTGLYDGGSNSGRPSERMSNAFRNLSGNIDWASVKANALGLGRMLTLNKANNKNLQDSMRARAALADPKNKHRYVYGDYTALEQAKNSAAQLQSLYGTARSSDATTNAALLLLAADKANSYANAGLTAYNKMLYTTGESLLKLDSDVYDYNHNIKTLNNAALTELANAKIKAITSTRTANATNLDNYLKGLELALKNKVKKQEAYQKQYDDLMDEFELAIAKQNNPEYKKLYDDYVQAYRSGDKDAYDRAYNALLAYNSSPESIIANAEAYAQYAKRHNLKVRDLRSLRTNGTDPYAGYSVVGVPTEKQGGKMDDTDSKRSYRQNTRLVKQVQDSINTLLKTLDRLSKEELLSIKKLLK